MDFGAFKDWVLLGLLGGGMYLLIDILKEIKNSIVELNTQIAVVISKQDDHEHRINQLESKHEPEN